MDRPRRDHPDDAIRPGETTEPSAPTVPVAAVEEDLPTDRHGRPVLVRVFGSHAYFRLWTGQVVSSLGDWLGFFAILVIAERVGGSSSEAAIGLVVGARILPGFFFSTVAGVLVDRWDRKKTMMACDVSRAVVLLFLPFIDTVWGLVVASLLLEIPTLLWSPAKEASVPNLVPPESLAAANSLGLVAAYGTFPVASLLFASMTKVADWLGGYESLEALRVNQESLAIYMDVVTFLVSALVISTLTLPPMRREVTGRIDFSQTFDDLKEGWRFIFINPVVRAVMIGLGTGLIGGGMLVPLGPIFAKDVLGSAETGFPLLLTGLGTGVALGILLLSVFQSRLDHSRAFVGFVIVAGLSLGLGATQSTLLPAVLLVGVLGICAGGVYVVGFTILHTAVDDELRGRIFSTLYTLVRMCLLLAMAAGPFLAGLLDALSDSIWDGQVTIADNVIHLPGVRLTLWLAAVIILFAGALAALALRDRPIPKLRNGNGNGNGSAVGAER